MLVTDSEYAPDFPAQVDTIEVKEAYAPAAVRVPRETLGVEDAVLLHEVAVNVVLLDGDRASLMLAHVGFHVRQLKMRLSRIKERWFLKPNNFRKSLVRQRMEVDLLLTELL